MILAFDQGTTSSRAVLVDAEGTVALCAQCELQTLYPRPGWVEQDPQQIWQTQLETANAALRQSHVPLERILAIGITNQRETTILWERATGKPVAPAIVWQDRRTAAACQALLARGLGGVIAQRTGLMLDPYFSATKIAWLLDETAGLRKRAERGEIAFGTVDSWLIWQLTGGKRHVTDITNASRTMLFDIHTGAWSDALLELFDVPAAMLPQVLPCTAEFGTTSPEIFGSPIRITGVAGDQQAALAGHRGFERGIAKNTYGTGSFLMLNTGDDPITSTHGLLATIAYAFDSARPVYALEGSIFATGAAVRWVAELLGLHDPADVESLARSVPDSAGVSLVPAFSGLGAPYWDPDARGAIVGLTRGTSRAHVARAVLEAMALQTCDAVCAMQHDAGFSLTELRVDGGAAGNDLAMQMQADLLGIDVVRSAVTQTTALGAAYFAGLQCGVWPNVAALPEGRRHTERFAPAITHRERTQRLERWHEAVERTRTRPYAG